MSVGNDGIDNKFPAPPEEESRVVTDDKGREWDAIRVTDRTIYLSGGRAVSVSAPTAAAVAAALKEPPVEEPDEEPDDWKSAPVTTAVQKLKARRKRKADAK